MRFSSMPVLRPALLLGGSTPVDIKEGPVSFGGQPRDPFHKSTREIWFGTDTGTIGRAKLRWVRRSAVAPAAAEVRAR